MATFMQALKTAILLLIVFTCLTGIIYPLTVTALAQIFFPQQANGSLIYHNDQLIGSVLIGQAFTQDHYFWGRPSHTADFPYNAAGSSGSNYSLSNPEFVQLLTMRTQQLQQNTQLIPIDLMMGSGSGLDPHISIDAALFQVPRIAKARQLSEKVVYDLINQLSTQPALGFLGPVYVNVLALNLALDKQQ